MTESTLVRPEPEPARVGNLPWVWSGRIPSLDGLRALAVLSVIFSHVDRYIAGAWALGHFGVTAFFVISGFLITLLMIRERRKTGSVSVKRFYQRRALRILPAYAALLVVVAILSAFEHYPIDRLSWIGALTYTSCFMTATMAPVLAHTWSLSVEEHFYFVWPLLFRICRSKIAISALAGFVLTAPLLRWEAASWNLPWIDPNYSSPLQLSSIASGALLAFLVTSDVVIPAAAAASAGGALFILSFALRVWPPVQSALADSLRAAAFGLAMLAILQIRSGNPVCKILNSKPFVVIGVLSYSLYLWQQPLAGILVPARYGIPLLFVVATLSYRFVERPFLNFKESIPKA